MEKTQFLTLLTNYTALTPEEARAVISLQDEFPYSQVLHNLCSRAAQDLNLDSREAFLHTSAIYTTERSVLKSIMTAAAQARREPVVVNVASNSDEMIVSKVVVEEVKVVNEPSRVDAPTTESPVAQNLPIDILQDLRDLEQARNKFEETIAKLENTPYKPTVKNLPKEEPVRKKKSSETVPADNLIEEIKSKKQVEPEGPNQKEQDEIIENFIKTQPKLAKSKPGANPPDGVDLAEESLQEGDHIVSETLVELLLKQGRKDKAIEVLKKLIWKIPQKKAYFAAQIEELKK